MKPIRVALFTYSTKPRGGVAHTLNLAEKLHGLGQKVHVYALGTDDGFFRRPSVPHTLIPCPKKEFASMDEKIRAYIEAYVDHLYGLGDSYDIYHAEDCISANALSEIRKTGRVRFFLRTVHHVDDFTSVSLAECQEKSITEPDGVLVVSDYWKRELADRYSVEALRVRNGVDLEKFAPGNGKNAPSGPSGRRFSADGASTVLTIGGIEPRKNTISTLKAFALVKKRLEEKGRRAVWLLGGGETLFDYRDYREQFFAEMERLNIREKKDVFILGRVEESAIAGLYAGADVFVFPSLREGWGLVALEAMASGVPVVASGIEPMTEFMEDGKNSLLVSPMDFEAIAEAIIRIMEDGALAEKLRAGGAATAGEYGWEAVALDHLSIYRYMITSAGSAAD